MFKGSLVALVTPMHMDGSIDEKSLYDLIEWHIASKTQGLVIAGTTGEGATLNDAEQYQILTTVVKQVGGRIPVIAGTGSYSTHHAAELTKQAKQAGCDGALIVTPYYNKPTQQGLFEHYQYIAKKVTIPIILYNVPSRTACDLLPETVARLAKIPNIIGIKEATGHLDRALAIFDLCGKSFLVFSGDDPTALSLLSRGAHGVISVTANILPDKMHALCEAAFSQNTLLMEQLNQALMPLHKNLFLESNPIPTKWALHKMGRIPAGIRLPLTTLNKQYHATLEKILYETGALAN